MAGRGGGPPLRSAASGQRERSVAIQRQQQQTADGRGPQNWWLRPTGPGGQCRRRAGRQRLCQRQDGERRPGFDWNHNDRPAVHEPFRSHALRSVDAPQLQDWRFGSRSNEHDVGLRRRSGRLSSDHQTIGVAEQRKHENPSEEDRRRSRDSRPPARRSHFERE